MAKKGRRKLERDLERAAMGLIGAAMAQLAIELLQPKRPVAMITKRPEQKEIDPPFTPYELVK